MKGMKGKGAVRKDKQMSKGALPGIAKGGGKSGGPMKGGGGMPNFPAANRPKVR